MRIEKDFLGSVEIPDHALYGIHTVRACENFPPNEAFSPRWYQALGVVKRACYLTYQKYAAAMRSHYPKHLLTQRLIDNAIIEALSQAAEEVSQGQWYEHFRIPALCGGAGTSFNMNINEILANRAKQILNGTTDVDPVEHANVFQSTNDVVPTALRLALLWEFETLEKAIASLRQTMEQKEKQYRNHLRFSYTQMQEAVPSTYGKLFGAYNEALSRDWWRISKCEERLKVVNLGAGATGTGIAAPRFFVLECVQTLRDLTQKPFARAEHLADATAHHDALVETHGILKSLAVTLEKIASDLRLLSADVGTRALTLPARQVGSSLMPGKINPVISEYVISVAHQVYVNDLLITQLAGLGCLDLNAYIPLIGHTYLKSLKLLQDACHAFEHRMLANVQVISSPTLQELYASPSLTTALVPLVGYHAATRLARYMKDHGVNIFEANQTLGILPHETLQRYLNEKRFTQSGYSVNDFS